MATAIDAIDAQVASEEPKYVDHTRFEIELEVSFTRRIACAFMKGISNESTTVRTMSCESDVSPRALEPQLF